jgi:hypothetical protein
VERGGAWDPAEGGGGGNLTGIPVLLRPNDKATERAALQRLKDLAPLALFSEDKSRAAVAPRLAGAGGWGACPHRLHPAGRHVVPGSLPKSRSKLRTSVAQVAGLR